MYVGVPYRAGRRLWDIFPSSRSLCRVCQRDVGRVSFILSLFSERARSAISLVKYSRIIMRALLPAFLSLAVSVRGRFLVYLLGGFLLLLSVTQNALAIRTLAQSCPACSSAASSVCAGQSSGERAANLATLVQACGSYDPGSCCSLRHGGRWEGVSACVCAGEEGGGVNMGAVGSLCGCQAGASRRTSVPENFGGLG